MAWTKPRDFTGRLDQEEILSEGFTVMPIGSSVSYPFLVEVGMGRIQHDFECDLSLFYASSSGEDQYLLRLVGLDEEGRLVFGSAEHKLTPLTSQALYVYNEPLPIYRLASILPGAAVAHTLFWLGESVHELVDETLKPLKPSGVSS